MRKARKIELIEGLPSDWYFGIAELGYKFEIEDEDENLYYILVGGVRFCIYKKDAKVIEWAKPSYADKQAEWIEKNDLKIGNKIRFVHTFEGWKYGFNYYSPEGYLYSKNSIYTIKEINNDHIKIKESPYPIPYFAFEPVKDEYRGTKGERL